MAARTLDARPFPYRQRARGALVAGVVIAAAFGALAPSAAHADTDDFTFDSFHADMTLTIDDDRHAELAVTETLVARFPDEDQNRGIVRAIVDDYDGVPLHTEVLSVTDADGDPVPFEIEEDDGFLEVATGDDSYVRGKQTYVISYTQRDTIRAFEDTDADEFYRDINGTGWQQPFGEVTATLTVDAELADALTGGAVCYRGGYGSSDRCSLDEAAGSDGSVVIEAADSELDAEETITVAVGFERGTFVPGEVERNAFERFAFAAAPVWHGGSILAIVGGLIVAIGSLLARRTGRDAPGRGVIVPEYAPPREVTVLQAATLVARPATAVPALLIDLAVSGHVRLLVDEDDDSAVTLEYVAPSPNDHERQRALDALFGAEPRPGARKRVGGDQQETAKRLADLASDAQDELRAAGLTEQPPRRWSSIFIYASVAIVLVASVCLFLSVIGRTFSWATAVGLGAAVVAVIVAIGSWRYRDRVTEAGAPVRDHLIGLRDYLRLAESDRLRMLQSPEGAERSEANGADPLRVAHVYERLLPYAIIWGVEKEWAEALETRVRESGAPLGWYDGRESFSSVYFLTTMNAVRSGSQDPASAWAGSGASSATGGSMGGGFAGGGMGGGGGGGR